MIYNVNNLHNFKFMKTIFYKICSQLDLCYTGYFKITLLNTIEIFLKFELKVNIYNIS